MTDRGSIEAEVFVLGTPFDPPGDRFRQMAREALPDENLVAARTLDDIVFYREKRQVLLSQLPIAGPLAQEAVQTVQESEKLPPNARSDVAWLPLQRE